MKKKLPFSLSKLSCVLALAFTGSTAISSEKVYSDFPVEVRTNLNTTAFVILKKHGDELCLPVAYRVDLELPLSIPEKTPGCLDVELLSQSEEFVLIKVPSNYLSENRLSALAKSLAVPLDPSPKSFTAQYDFSLLNEKSKGTQVIGFVRPELRSSGNVNYSATLALSDFDGKPHSLQLLGLQREQILQNNGSFILGEYFLKTSAFGLGSRLIGASYASAGIKRPDLLDSLSTTVEGELDVASEVTLFINGTRLLNQRLQAGRYAITDVPLSAGKSNVLIVTKDVLGVEKIRTLEFGSDQQGYIPGRVDYSLDAGYKYEQYGQLGSPSFSSYVEKAFSRSTQAFGSLGHSDQETQFLVGVNHLVGDYLKVSPFYSEKKLDLSGPSVSYYGGSFSLSFGSAALSHTYKAHSRTIINSIQDSYRESLSSFSVSIGAQSLINLTLGSQIDNAQNKLSVKSLFYSTPISDTDLRATFGFSKIDGIDSLQVGLSIPLERASSFSSYSKLGKDQSFSSGYTQNQDPVKLSNFSFLLNKGVSDSSVDSINTKYERAKESGVYYFDSFIGKTDQVFRAGLKGALIYDPDTSSILKTRHLSSSMVLVEDADPNTVYLLNGREFKGSDKSVNLFPISPFIPQKISVDPDSLLPETNLDAFNYSFKATGEGLVRLKFPRAPAGQEIALTGPDGMDLPEGSLLVSDSSESVVGENSRSFVLFKEGELIEVLIPRKNSCKFTYTISKRHFYCEQ